MVSLPVFHSQMYPYIGQNSPIVNVGDIELQKWENTPEQVKAKSP